MIRIMRKKQTILLCVVVIVFMASVWMIIHEDGADELEAINQFSMDNYVEELCYQKEALDGKICIGQVYENCFVIAYLENCGKGDRVDYTSMAKLSIDLSIADREDEENYISLYSKDDKELIVSITVNADKKVFSKDGMEIDLDKITTDDGYEFAFGFIVIDNSL